MQFELQMDFEFGVVMGSRRILTLKMRSRGKKFEEPWSSVYKTRVMVDLRIFSAYCLANVDWAMGIGKHEFFVLKFYKESKNIILQIQNKVQRNLRKSMKKKGESFF